MPHFCPKCGADEVICQRCGRILCSKENKISWRPDISGHASAGNVCQSCVETFNRGICFGNSKRGD